MSTGRKLDKAALTALRKARRAKMKAPVWGDHVLRGVRGFTVAGKLVADTGRKVMETLNR